jgi:predicted amidohydrolase
MATNQGRASALTVACVNFAPVWHDVAGTLAKMLAAIREAAAQGADFVVFPEGALPGPVSCEGCRTDGRACPACRSKAETVPGPSSQAVLALARELDVHVVYGMSERDPDDPDVLYNAAAFVAPEGILGTYRKVHLGALPWVTEGVTYRPGTSLPLFPTRFGPVGVQICYDFWFNPELTRLLALKGARLVLCPVASFAAPGRPDSMRATVLARAQENLIHVAVANIAATGMVAGGEYSGTGLTEALRPDVYAGHSMIAGPAFPRFGHVWAEAGPDEEIVLATLNLDRLDRFETVFDYRAWRAGRLRSASQLVADEFAALVADEDPGAR